MTSRAPVAFVLALSLVAAAMSVLATPASAATTFVVNKTGDASDRNVGNGTCDTSTKSGKQCTLRAAIQEANSTTISDTINFNITSTSKVIAPATPLPPITEAVSIDGYSQPGSSVNTLATGNNAVIKIVLDGVIAGPGANGLVLGGYKSVIKGLVVQRFDGSGLVLTGQTDQVYGCFIGTNAAGTAARANSVGITVAGTSATIGGSFVNRNVISGNAADGVLIAGNSAAVIGNYIGTRKGGTVALPNGGNGIRIEGASGSRIGLPSAGLGNLISGNGGNGVHVYKSSGASDTRIEGNLIGTNATGMAALSNAESGVYTDALSVQIGGDTALEGNVISGNGDAGITLQGSDDNVVQGNLIGTKADGGGDVGNGGAGVSIDEAGDDNLIGGPSDGMGNLISGNGSVGISLFSGINNVVQGNVIWLNDFSGIAVADVHDTIANNDIFSNGRDGVAVYGVNTSGIRITGNRIFTNVELGIDLLGGTENSFGVTANDTDDPDGAPNTLQNFPILTLATRSNATGLTTVIASLNSNPSTQFMIEVFQVVTPDPSGNGEGQVLKASQNVTTNSGGDVAFQVPIAGLAPGVVLTATATSTTAGNSSEFSAYVVVVPVP